MPAVTAAIHPALTSDLGPALGVAEPGIVFFGELAAVTPDGNDVLASFQTLDGWHVIEDYFSPGLYALESSRLSGPGREPTGSAAFSWASRRDRAHAGHTARRTGKAHAGRSEQVVSRGGRGPAG